MSAGVSEFDILIQKVREGSQQAAWELIQKYSSQILRVVRRRLPDGLRQKFDSQDFEQAAWMSVFAHRSRLGKCATAKDFVAYLGQIAANKVNMEVRRRYYGKKYNVTREESLNKLSLTDSEVLHAVQDSASEVAMMRENWLQFIEGQPEHYQRIVAMRYAGKSMREIADELKLHEGTVRRALKQMHEEVCT
jgi:RNA polymerase sigma factor (sigma-70 family)